VHKKDKFQDERNLRISQLWSQITEGEQQAEVNRPWNGVETESCLDSLVIYISSFSHRQRVARLAETLLKLFPSGLEAISYSEGLI